MSNQDDLNAITESKKEVEINSMFGKIICFDDDLITRHICRFGNHTRPEFAFATSIIQVGEKIFDIGGHIGTFSLLAISKVGPQGSILAVEGNGTTYSVLKRNMAAHPRATCINCFVGSGISFGYVDNDSNTGAGRLVVGGSIETTTLDELVSKYFEPTYIKIDVEGFEGRIIYNSEYVKQALPTLYLEINEELLGQNETDSKQIITFLKDLGYEFYINSGARNAPHDIFWIESLNLQSLPNKMFDVLCVNKKNRVSKIIKKCLEQNRSG